MMFMRDQSTQEQPVQGAGEERVVMGVRKIVVCAALGTLFACSPPTFDIIAQGTADAVVFTARDSGGSMRYVEASSLSVTEGARRVWDISFTPTDSCRADQRSPHPFPVRYGTVPECWVQTQAAERLRDGTTYSVAGYDGSRQGGGDFRIDGGHVIFIDTHGNW
jgi:hypothetical protein